MVDRRRTCNNGFKGDPKRVKISKFEFFREINGSSIKFLPWDASVCAVYAIYNTIENKVYVGGTVHTDRRANLHILQLRESKHPNQSIQQAYKAHGEESFTLCILEQVSRATLEERENHWLEKVFGSAQCYNVYKATKVRKEENPRFGIPRTEETKRKISESGRGKKQSLDSIEKMRQSKIGKKQSEEHRLKSRAILSRNSEKLIKRFSESDVKSMLDKYIAGSSLVSLCREYDTCDRVVIRVLKEQGIIEFRTLKEQMIISNKSRKKS